MRLTKTSSISAKFLKYHSRQIPLETMLFPMSIMGYIKKFHALSQQHSPYHTSLLLTSGDGGGGEGGNVTRNLGPRLHLTFGATKTTGPLKVLTVKIMSHLKILQVQITSHLTTSFAIA